MKHSVFRRINRGGFIPVSTVLRKSVRNTGKGIWKSSNPKTSRGSMLPKRLETFSLFWKLVIVYYRSALDQLQPAFFQILRLRICELNKRSLVRITLDTLYLGILQVPWRSFDRVTGSEGDIYIKKISLVVVAKRTATTHLNKVEPKNQSA